MSNNLISNSASHPNMCDLTICEMVALVVCWCCIVLQMRTMAKSVRWKSPSRIAARAQISLPWFMERSGSQLSLQAPSLMEAVILHKDKEIRKN